LKETIKIQNHRNANFITSEKISDEDLHCGINAIWYENNNYKTKKVPPLIGEICLIRIEGNYEIDLSKNLWIQFETWDSNQNGISNLEHIQTNRLSYGQIIEVVKHEENYFNCKFQVKKNLNLDNIQSSKSLNEKWKKVIIDFAKLDFTGSLLTVNKFDKYYSTICQTDGGPFFRLVFRKGDNIQLIHIVECDKYEDELITYSNQIIDNETEIILESELRRKIKVFKYEENSFSQFLFYIDQENTPALQSELLKGHRLILRKGLKREIINEESEIESTLNKMKDYH